MLLQTRAADPIELVQCGDCDLYASREECDSFGWAWDEPNGQWRCERCYDDYAEYWGILRAA